MRDKSGWELTKKQREKYLDNIKMLYGPPSNGSSGIVAPRVSMEDLGLSHENLKPSGMGSVVTHLPGPKAAPEVSRRTLKPKTRKEWREQEDIFKWTQMVQSLQGHVMMIGNEGRRTVVQAAVAKRMGLLSGASDLFIAVPAGIYHGLWLECKQNREYTPSERAKDHWKRQEAFLERMKSVGYAGFFCFGAESGIKIIKDYLSRKIDN